MTMYSTITGAVCLLEHKGHRPEGESIINHAAPASLQTVQVNCLRHELLL